MQLKVDVPGAKQFAKRHYDNQRYENAYKTGGVQSNSLDNSRLQLKNASAVSAQKRSSK